MFSESRHATSFENPALPPEGFMTTREIASYAEARAKNAAAHESEAWKKVEAAARSYEIEPVLPFLEKESVKARSLERPDLEEIRKVTFSLGAFRDLENRTYLETDEIIKELRKLRDEHVHGLEMNGDRDEAQEAKDEWDTAIAGLSTGNTDEALARGEDRVSELLDKIAKAKKPAKVLEVGLDSARRLRTSLLKLHFEQKRP